tara:strand:+ start:1007 stop:1177 length:171 start_codon:yes stop_codon:yes gene_type:complete
MAGGRRFAEFWSLKSKKHSGRYGRRFAPREANILQACVKNLGFIFHETWLKALQLD